MYVLQLSTCVYTSVNLAWIFQFFSTFKLTNNTFEMMPRNFCFSAKCFILKVCDYNYNWKIYKYYTWTENLSQKQIKLEIFPTEDFATFDTLFENSVLEIYFGSRFLNRLRADCIKDLFDPPNQDGNKSDISIIISLKLIQPCNNDGCLDKISLISEYDYCALHKGVFS